MKINWLPAPLTFFRFRSVFSALILFCAGVGCGSEISAPSKKQDEIQEEESDVEQKDCTEEQASASPFAGGNGSESAPYQICTADQLYQINFTSGSDVHFALMTDLDLTVLPANVDYMIIGQPAADGFNAIFDGNGHTISNLAMIIDFSSTAGLFPTINQGAEVRGLNITNADVASPSGQAAGIIAGFNQGKIINSHSSGSVSGVEAVGGLVGSNSGVIEKSSSSALVAGSDALGGLTGKSSGTIDRCFSTGSVAATATTIAADGPGTGGLVGAQTGGTIQDSYSTASVTGHARVGGLVGSMSRHVEVVRSYFAGIVELSADPASYPAVVGGLVGFMLSDTSIAQSFSAGKVVENATGYSGGGLVGASEGGVVTNSFWDVSRSLAVSCIDSDNLLETSITSGCTATNVDNASPNYFFISSSAGLSDWDFTTIWQEVSEDFPNLR